MQSHYQREVSYFYNEDIGNYYYGNEHPMEPIRINITHDLIYAYGLYPKMHVHRPVKASYSDMHRFHGSDYLNFLKAADQETQPCKFREDWCQFNVNDDCPVFPGVYSFSQISAGGSLAAAVRLMKNPTEICINWSGGMHHAKVGSASGFCYINDIVLAIQEMLKYYRRILYIDIDVHHGDGVIEAFYATNRVMKLSFHKFGHDFFPGSGNINELGYGEGRYYTVNVPLNDGITDAAYKVTFEAVVSKVIECYRPDAVVMQCGADSLTGDAIGCFNLTLKGHSHCVNYVKNLNLPLMLLGGGGYTIKNVARCWTYETAVALGVEIPNELPPNNFMHVFSPSRKLHISQSNRMNQNTRIYLQQVKYEIFENLRNVEAAPSVQIQDCGDEDVRELYKLLEDEYENRMEDESPDERTPVGLQDMVVERENEFFMNDNDNDHSCIDDINVEVEIEVSADSNDDAAIFKVPEVPPLNSKYKKRRRSTSTNK